MRSTATIAVAVAGTAFVLGGCGSSGETAQVAIGTSAVELEEMPVEIETPAGCSAERPADANGDPLIPVRAETGVRVGGPVGEAPDVVVPRTAARGELVVEVLHEGDGEPVRACDFVGLDYYGQTWVPGDDTADNVFDQSYERGEPFRTTLGGGNVIKGWDAGLDGIPVGSRVLLSVPPEYAYGGAESGHELGGETLLFVVDVAERIAAGDGTVSGEAVEDLPDELPTVSGVSLGEPVLDLTDAEAPEHSDATLLVAGDGPEIGENIVVKILQKPYDGSGKVSTWRIGHGPIGRWPNGTPVTVNDLPDLAEALDGQRVGSRALVRIGSQDNADGGALAIVLDVVGTYNTSS